MGTCDRYRQYRRECFDYSLWNQPVHNQSEGAAAPATDRRLEGAFAAANSLNRTLYSSNDGDEHSVQHLFEEELLLRNRYSSPDMHPLPSQSQSPPFILARDTAGTTAMSEGVAVILTFIVPLFLSFVPLPSIFLS